MKRASQETLKDQIRDLLINCLTLEEPMLKQKGPVMDAIWTTLSENKLWELVRLPEVPLSIKDSKKRNMI